jgi:hypothetical protein
MMLPLKFSAHAALLALSLAATFAVTAPAYAGTAPGNARTTVIRSVSFVINGNLDFGTVIGGTTAGTVTISNKGTRSRTGGITLANGGGHKPATFSGQATVNQMFKISAGASSISLTGPGAPMRVRNFVIGTAGGTTLGNAPLTIWNNYPNGIFGFNVGATLDVGANQAPGKYTGTWSITLNYV